MIDIKKTKYEFKVINFIPIFLVKDNIECEYFTVISIASLILPETKYYLWVYLGNCTYKIVEQRMIDFLGKNPFQIDENWFLINGLYK